MSSGAARISLMTGYLLLSGVLALVLWTAASSAPVVQQIEANLGRPLTCDEAYNHREINNYFYPQRAAQGDALYRFSLVSPFFLLGFAILLAAIGYSGSLNRLRWPLVAVGLLLFAGLLVYMPVIRTIACAVE